LFVPPRLTLIFVAHTQHSRRELARHGRISEFVLVHRRTALCSPPHTGSYTLFSLWRTYSALNKTLSPDALTLPPPRRVLYPNLPTFVGERPDDNEPLPRQRSPSGFHPLLAKAAFPTLGLLYAEDWADYALLHVPFLIKRAVVADQGAARRAGPADVPPFAVPLVELEASKAWWEPVRRSVARFLDVPEEAPKKAWLSKSKTVVTYLSRQDAVGGARLRAGDHAALVRALGELRGSAGYEVHVVSGETSWVERMRAIAQSTVSAGRCGVRAWLTVLAGRDWGVWGPHGGERVRAAVDACDGPGDVFPGGVFEGRGGVGRGAGRAVRGVVGSSVGGVSWCDGRVGI
jgi:hypothetical protein